MIDSPREFIAEDLYWVLTYVVIALVAIAAAAGYPTLAGGILMVGLLGLAPIFWLFGDLIADAIYGRPGGDRER